jgi:hypothetical protein
VNARAALAAIALALLLAGAATDLPRASQGQFWSDGATYYAMAWSLASDGDLTWGPEDLARVRREFPGGPQGLFLKRGRGDGLYFAKAFAYPVAAAPLVFLFGTRGLPLLNALCLACAVAFGYAIARPGRAPANALLLAAAVLLCGAAPIYLVWPQPELFNLALLCGALWAWRAERPLLSALLFGIATYSKPTNLLVAAPLGLAPFVGHALSRGLRESLRRGAALLATAAALYALNAALTGEWNYQGGERKTFYARYPFDPGVGFDNAGVWMTTEQVGAAVPEAGAEAQAKERGVIERPREELRAAFLRNAAYFWVGRFAGVAAYFFPAALAALLFAARGPRDRDGWLALSALAVSALVYVALIPDNWYGGGGTLGNRYFLNLLPLALLFAPRGREPLFAACSALAAGVLLGPALLEPVRHSLQPWRHALREPFRLFPLELSMLNDLGFCSDPWRKKQPFLDPDRNPRGYWLYFPDDGTYGREVIEGREGFWLRRGRSATLVLRALQPVTTIGVRLNGGPDGDVVRLEAGKTTQGVPLRPGESRELALEPGAGYPFYLSHVYTLRLGSQAAPVDTAGRPDARALGAFVRLQLDPLR